jgi:hypothetical protein
VAHWFRREALATVFVVGLGDRKEHSNSKDTSYPALFFTVHLEVFQTVSSYFSSIELPSMAEHLRIAVIGAGKLQLCTRIARCLALTVGRNGRACNRSCTR